ncbi:hypothetical protein PAXRUDRAFT_831626 [Paxillus rubicundulus Ve08.2h10]|uniref:Uncharacterized protein n=1 Tax=Paxillus rubicundulus Ve08.2h10 TaxID=930991 RepID=A0A0D0DHZ5_9AGAM|nr:hypothetical protein PAXRUDRAFT_831626 [Paxillus rubicundulus Ve08.2h10]
MRKLILSTPSCLAMSPPITSASSSETLEVPSSTSSQDDRSQKPRQILVLALWSQSVPIPARLHQS